jgi:hypothetical protein
LITPPNFGSGGGSCLPSSVVVAPGEPGAPVVTCAATGAGDSHSNAQPASSKYLAAVAARCGTFIVAVSVKRVDGPPRMPFLHCIEI